MNIPDDVEAFVIRRFAPKDQSEALALLRTARIHDGTEASERLLRCAVVASQGNLARLRRQVGELAVDYRDVIVAGEYNYERGELVQVRDLNQPLQV